MDGERRVHKAAILPPGLAPEEVGSLLEPPSDLTMEEQACWREAAPLALAERTLGPNQVTGFRELCTRLANIRLFDKRIAVLGAASTEALPYLKERRGWAVLLSGSLKDFKLTAFGKPVTSEQQAPPVNQWANLAKKK